MFVGKINYQNGLFIHPKILKNNRGGLCKRIVFTWTLERYWM